MFTFIYSKRPGTAAAKLQDDVSREQKQKRFNNLLKVQNLISDEKHIKYVGKTVKVLVDVISGDKNYPLQARTNGGRLVHLKGNPELFGCFCKANITHSSTWALFGEVL